MTMLIFAVKDSDYDHRVLLEKRFGLARNTIKPFIGSYKGVRENSYGIYQKDIPNYFHFLDFVFNDQEQESILRVIDGQAELMFNEIHESPIDGCNIRLDFRYIGKLKVTADVFDILNQDPKGDFTYDPINEVLWTIE